MSKKQKPEKPFDWRTYPHANSQRKIIDRTKSDNEEVAEFTPELFKNRKGGIHNVPNLYDDTPTSRSGKYPVKPKKNDKKHDTIRRKESEDVNESSEEYIDVFDE